MRTSVALALIAFAAVPSGGCGLVGVLLHRGGIRVCNGAEPGEAIEAIAIQGVDCHDPLDPDPPPGLCDDQSDDTVEPGDCAEFSGLAVGAWAVHVTWSDGLTSSFEVYVAEGAPTELSVRR